MKFALLAALSFAAISCAGGKDEGLGRDAGADGGAFIACSNDMQCANSGACIAKRCVDRLGSMDTWAIELTPPPPANPDPGSYGPLVTELSSLGAPPVVLSASATLPLVARFTADSALGIPTTATVILTVPSRIPGRPDLSFQADLKAGPTTTTPLATLSVSDVVLGQRTSVNLIPLPPADLTTPQYTFVDKAIAASGPMIETLPLPAPSFKISGRLVDALDGAKGSFTARAFQGGLLASTTAITSTTDGGFTILLPAGTGPVDLELLPDSDVADPWMILQQLPLSAAPKDLGPITVPVHPPANAFRVTVHGNTSDQAPVADVSVHAVATLPGGDMRGMSRYLRDGFTDANGIAQLTLIPGDSQTALMYALSVVPPPGSTWATQCVTGVPVLWNGSGTPTIQDFALVPRPVVSGTLLSADGAPVANAAVTATRGPSAASDCLLGPATTSVITDATGAFKLPLDAGDHYQIDFDPPSGSAAPRWTEYDVSVNGDVPKTFFLPRPALFEGDVEDAQGNPLKSATIRVFEPRPCPPPNSCWLPPRLRGQTQSDDDKGHFRVIVAAPSTAN